MERRLRLTDRRGNHYMVRRPQAEPYHEARCYTALQLLGDLIGITLVLRHHGNLLVAGAGAAMIHRCLYCSRLDLALAAARPLRPRGPLAAAVARGSYLRGRRREGHRGAIGFIVKDGLRR